MPDIVPDMDTMINFNSHTLLNTQHVGRHMSMILTLLQATAYAWKMTCDNADVCGQRLILARNELEEGTCACASELAQSLTHK